MKPVSVIINPVAGKGKGKHVGEWLVQALADRRIDAEIHFSGAPGEVTRWAQITNRSIVVAVGGDGTISEVVNGIVGSGKSLAIIPAGSGNDLIKALNIPFRPELALERLFAGHEKQIDIGTIACNGDSRTGYFVNGVGAGFDAAVAVKTRQIRFLRGLPLYIAAVLKTLGEYKAPMFDIRIDGRSLTGRKLLIAIGNGTSAGGGFLLTPQAQVDDGVLDICMIDDLRIMQILAIMPKVIKGNHLLLDAVTMGTGSEIGISADKPFVVHADGEIVAASCTHTSIGVRKLALTVLS